MNEQKKRISDAEWEVMNLLWLSDRSLTSMEIVERVARSRDWQPNTIKTLINRLVGKGFVEFRPLGNRYLYSPTVDRAETVRAESDSFIRKVFRGDAVALLSHFVETADLTEDEIADLVSTLDRRRGADSS